MDDNLLNLIGGESTVHQTVDSFFARIGNDPLLQLALNHSDLEALRATQKTLLPITLQQPPESVCNDIQQTLTQLIDIGFGEEHFGAVISHVQGALEDSNIPLQTIEDLLELIETAHDEAFGMEAYF